VRALNLESCVHFLGGVHDVIPVVKHFTVSVLCSETEGSSNAVIEYMGCGTPTVCTRVGGNPELIEDGQTGFLVDRYDVNALSDRMNVLLDKAGLRAWMGRRARLVARNFTIDRMADGHMRLYERLVERKAGIPLTVREKSAAARSSPLT
jgi:glycosyltransferase involved in cell wall biosynthesis